MAVGYRSSSTTATTDDYASTVAVPVPAGAASGDIAVVGLVRWEASNPAITPPAGFTQVTQAVNGNEKLAIFWKRLSGADSGTYTFSWTGSQYSGGQCVLITGALAAGDPIGSNFNTATANSATIPTTSVTVAFAPFLAHFVSHEDSRTHTPPTSFTEVQDASYLAANYRIPGTTGTLTAPSGALSSASLLCAGMVAVEPASGGGGSVTLDGIGSASSGATGSASTARSVAANASAANGGTGGLSAARSVTGSASAANGAAGSMSAARGIAASSAASSSLAGDFTTSTQKNLDGIAAAAASLTGATAVARGLAGSSSSASDGSALSSVARSIAGMAAAAAYATGDLTLAAQSWRLVMPAIRETWPIAGRGALRVSTYREATVFGDEDGLFTVSEGAKVPGTDDWGSIPFGTKYIWYGGHVNTTDDPAVRALWLAHGFEVQNV